MIGKSRFVALMVPMLVIMTPAYAQNTDAVDSTARGGVVAVADRVTALEGMVAQLQADLSGAQAAIATAQAELAGAQNRIGALETELSVANGRVGTLEADLATATGRIGDLETGLATANGRLGAAENGIALLAGDLAALQDSDSIQNDLIIGLRIDLSEAERVALRSETRSSGGVARKLSLKDPLFTFRTNNTATVTAIDGALATLNVFRCRFGLFGCTDPSIEQLIDFLPVDSVLTFEATVDAWESDLVGLRSLAQSGTVQITETQILGVLDDIESQMGTLGDIGQLAAFDLQDSTQQMTVLMQVISNLMKQNHDTLLAIINNIRA